MHRVTSNRNRYRILTASYLFCLALIAGSAFATPFTVTIDTSALIGSNVQLAFDFIDGGPPANSLTISNFLTDGTLGSLTTIGSVSGDIATSLVMEDSSFFNEALYDITLGTTLSFLFAATNNSPDAASFPDTFSFFLIDPITGLSFIATADPTGANTLFAVEINGAPSGNQLVFSGIDVDVPVTISAVPEPGTGPLVLSALLGLLALKLRGNISLNRSSC
jgi:hypothetical protein